MASVWPSPNGNIRQFVPVLRCFRSFQPPPRYQATGNIRPPACARQTCRVRRCARRAGGSGRRRGVVLLRRKPLGGGLEGRSPPNTIRTRRHARRVRKPCAARFPCAFPRPRPQAQGKRVLATKAGTDGLCRQTKGRRQGFVDGLSAGPEGPAPVREEIFIRACKQCSRNSLRSSRPGAAICHGSFSR